MFLYHLRIAWLSIRRHPLLSALLVAAVALGVAMSTASFAAYTVYAGDPIPHKSDRLFYVQVDSWKEDKPFDEDAPHKPPNQLTYMDMVALMQSDIPTRQSGLATTGLTAQPKNGNPFAAAVRLCFSDFFSLFDVPFAYGGGWNKTADLGPEPVVVIDHETNEKLFKGGNSVGRSIRLDNQIFTVAGVLAPWYPKPRFYDPNGGGVSFPPEAIFMPFAWLRVMQLTNHGNTSCYGKLEPGVEGRLASECVWIQMWVQLDSARQKAAYLSFLDAYATTQKKLGRFRRPLNNRVLSVMEFLDDENLVPDEAEVTLLLSLMFLFVCSVNLVGILLGKFLARAPEVGVRRALGASRWSLFVQHLVECEVIGLLGGAVGLLLSTVVLAYLNREFEQGAGFFSLDARTVVAALILSLGAGLVAGIYPTWRICRVAPAIHLKLR